MEYNELEIDELDELSLVNVPAQAGADAVAIGKASTKISIVDFKKSARQGRQAHQAMACADCGDDVAAGQEDCPTCGAYMPIHKADDEFVKRDTFEAPLAFGKRYFSSHERQYLARSGAAMPNGGFPIQDATDLHNAIQAFGRAKNKSSAAAHIKQRARSLGLTSMLPKDGELAGLAKSNPASQENVMEDTIEKKMKDLEARNAEIQKSNDILKSLLNLPFAEQAYALRLPDTERPLFLAKSADERAKVAEPLYVSKADGTKFYRTDDQRMIDLAKRTDLQDEKFAKMLEQEEVRKFEDDARNILKHLSGTVQRKAQLLRIVTKHVSDEKERTELIDMLKANDAGISNALKVLGNVGDPLVNLDGTAAGEFEQGVKKYAEIKKMSDMALAEAEYLDTKEGQERYAAMDAERVAGSNN